MCLIYRVKTPLSNSSEVHNIENLIGKNEVKTTSETSHTLMQSLTATSALSAETALETESLLVKNGKSYFNTYLLIEIFLRKKIDKS